MATAPGRPNEKTWLWQYPFPIIARYATHLKDAADNPNTLDVRLGKPHPQQQRGLGPRAKSAFLNISFLCQHQSIGLHRHSKTHRNLACLNLTWL